MAKRYELPGVVWDLVADIFYEPRRSGRPQTGDRLMRNSILCVLSLGAARRNTPERLVHGRRFISAFVIAAFADR